ncbi:hypothetical protein DFI02_102690 [Rhizobium sp. PP-F2F-G20b]|nr:hypothetical protein DFI02_102690 [Rhizobium sp. PP-F2F-G20b]
MQIKTVKIFECVQVGGWVPYKIKFHTVIFRWNLKINLPLIWLYKSIATSRNSLIISHGRPGIDHRNALPIMINEVIELSKKDTFRSDTSQSAT